MLSPAQYEQLREQLVYAEQNKEVPRQQNQSNSVV
jgi:hypothetical protein